LILAREEGAKLATAELMPELEQARSDAVYYEYKFEKAEDDAEFWKITGALGLGIGIGSLIFFTLN